MCALSYGSLSVTEHPTEMSFNIELQKIIGTHNLIHTTIDFFVPIQVNVEKVKHECLPNVTGRRGVALGRFLRSDISHRERIVRGKRNKKRK